MDVEEARGGTTTREPAVTGWDVGLFLRVLEAQCGDSRSPTERPAPAQRVLAPSERRRAASAL